VPEFGRPSRSLLECLGGGPRGAGSVAQGDEQRESVQARPVEITKRGPTQVRFAQFGRELVAGRDGVLDCGLVRAGALWCG
jgi:hypothetical protein